MSEKIEKFSHEKYGLQQDIRKLQDVIDSKSEKLNNLFDKLQGAKVYFVAEKEMVGPFKTWCKEKKRELEECIKKYEEAEKQIEEIIDKTKENNISN